MPLRTEPRRPTIVTGAAVFTGDRTRPWTDALAVRGDRVVAVGDADEVRRRAPDGREVALGGRVIVPGFVDAHNHAVSTGESMAMADVRAPGVASADQLIAVVERLAVTAAPGEPIAAYGFDHAKYPGHDYPTRDELDRAAPHNPVLLYHVSGHHVLVNSASLVLAGTDESTPDPPGGQLVRDATGRLTGLCLDAAMALAAPTQVDIGSHGPNFHTVASRARLVDAVERAGVAFLAAGLTTVCDAQVTAREMTAYGWARAERRLHVRMICMPLSHQLAEYTATGIATGLGDDALAIGPMKLYADGTLTGGTAAFGPESGVADRSGASFFHEPARLRELIIDAYRGGWRVGVHAQGDLAIEAVLDAFEAAAAAYPQPDARPRLEHAGFPTPAQIARMATLGVVPVTQPAYLHDNGDQYRVLLGPAADRLQPWRQMLDAGLRPVISSDSDVSDFRPLETLRHALLRTSRGGDVLGEGERLTLEEALFAHTIDAAFACGWEDRVGSLEPGKLADFVVLDSDRGSLDADIRSASSTVRATVLGGDPRFDADGSFAPISPPD